MLDYNCYLKPHGTYQIELKVKYPVQNRKNSYELECYLFSPKVLAVDRKSYGVSGFLNDLRIMTRISTPEIVIPRLIDDECRESPIARIRYEINGISQGRRGRSKKIIYELRTLASIIRVQMRKNRIFLAKKLEDEEDAVLLTGWLNEFAAQVESFLKCFRELKPLFINPEINEKLNMAFDWTDESISLNIQREIGVMLKICSGLPETSGCAGVLTGIIDREIEHRIERKYQTGIRVPDKRSSGELIVYRENILKKWSQSAMYLNVTKSRTPARVGQIIAGTAAAAAMTFAVIATLLTDHFFPANTAAWALAAVIAYIFKDRIKETLRSGLRTLMPRSIPDQMVVLRDSSVQKRSGHTKSFVKFMSAENLPAPVKSARRYEQKPFRELLPAENVIRYRHEVVLDGHKFFRNHERMESVTEIIRLELHKFMQLMDDPDQIYFYTKDGSISKKRLRRVYHLNLVVVLNDKSEGSESIHHYRVIINRDGIVRIEKA